MLNSSFSRSPSGALSTSVFCYFALYQGGETSETPSNGYTPKSSLKESPNGKRIDYIMYKVMSDDLCARVCVLFINTFTKCNLL